MIQSTGRISSEELQEIDLALSSPDESTRWQAAIALGGFSETDPEAIWPLVEKWGSSANEDTRAAIATCVLEHILDAWFVSFFERAERLIREGNVAFADTFCRCSQFGEAREPGNRERFRRLRAKAQRLCP